MNTFVKIEKGYKIWFLLLDSIESIPEGFSEKMQEQILRSEVCELHNPNAKFDFTHRVIMAATREIDYGKYVDKYGTILVQPVGSFMPLGASKITEYKTSEFFPVDEFADIVICENDQRCEHGWKKYLQTAYPDQSIAVINFFDLRDETEVRAYFEKASLVTFSTTFTRMEWFEKLAKCLYPHNKVIGYSHNPMKWKEAIQMLPDVTIIENL
jgi:hypothetical protein